MAEPQNRETPHLVSRRGARQDKVEDQQSKVLFPLIDVFLGFYLCFFFLRLFFLLFWLSLPLLVILKNVYYPLLLCLHLPLHCFFF